MPLKLGVIMYKIIKIEKMETNPYYDTEKCFDGCCYSQPLWTIWFDDGSDIDVLNISCGAFETMYYAKHSEGKLALWGSMYSYEVSDFTEDDYDIINVVEEATGIRIPTNEDLLVQSNLFLKNKWISKANKINQSENKD